MSTAELSYLDRLLEPLSRCFTPAVARKIADLRADPAVQGRIDELAARANEDQLTEPERVEYETYVRALDLIAILQAKARSVAASASKS